MRAYHFLRDDYTAGQGSEPAWQIGEERICPKPELISLCEYGYHSSPTWYDALGYAPGNVACIVDVSEPLFSDGDKQVSVRRKLIVAKDVEWELRLWGCDCAERALQRERAAGREPDKRFWEAIAVTRRYVAGEAMQEEWAAARAAARAATRVPIGDSARAAARAATWDPAWGVARHAARAVARAAARYIAWNVVWNVLWSAAWDAEIEWQRQHLAAMLDRLFAAADGPGGTLILTRDLTPGSSQLTTPTDWRNCTLRWSGWRGIGQTRKRR